MADQPPAYLSSPREAALGLLAALRQQHGSVEAYAAGIGVDGAAVASLREVLLD